VEAAADDEEDRARSRRQSQANRFDDSTDLELEQATVQKDDRDLPEA
jgi:hypothetical protein